MEADAGRDLNSGTLWADIRELLNAWDKRNIRLRKDVQARLEHLRSEGQSAWRRRITGDSNKRIRDHAREKMETFVERPARKFITGDENVQIRDHLKTTPVVKLIDRVSFTLGVSHFALTEFVVLSKPQWFAQWYTFTILLTLSLRTWSYYDKRWHFFMLDFCYYAGVLCLVSIHVVPSSTTLWKINYLLAHGPLMVAILAWRNSLVFHSLDKVTSTLIHFMPPLLTFLARWYPEESGFHVCQSQDAVSNQCPSLSVKDAILYPCIAYIVWQAGQIFITEVVFGSMLSNDKTLQTSMRWLCKDYRNGMHQICKKVCRQLGIFSETETFDPETWKSKIIFWVAQLIYTLITLVPGIIVYHNYYLNAVFLVCVNLRCIWNGASFYIEVFAERYRLKFMPTGDTASGDYANASFVDPDSLPTDVEEIRKDSSKAKKS